MAEKGKMSGLGSPDYAARKAGHKAYANIHKATRSVGPVEWTPYPTDLENAHRDALGKWC
jgi:hypothetical protein